MRDTVQARAGPLLERARCACSLSRVFDNPATHALVLGWFLYRDISSQHRNGRGPDGSGLDRNLV